MGVVAVRRSGTRVVTSVHRSQRMSTQYTGRSPSEWTLQACRIGAYAPISQWPADAPKTFWERFEDDRDLIRLKVVLLTSLALITALLERVA
jgi:hypothetical protein